MCVYGVWLVTILSAGFSGLPIIGFGIRKSRPGSPVLTQSYEKTTTYTTLENICDE